MSSSTLAPAPPALNSYMSRAADTKMIAFFQPKGGVAKTSSTLTFGHGLAGLGYKVLIIDADVQHNLTDIVLGHRMELRGHDFGTYLDMMRAPGSPAAGAPFLLGQALSRGLPAGGGLVPAYTVPVASFPRNDGGPTGELHLLMGDDELTEFEEAIANAGSLMRLAGSHPQRDVPGTPYHLALMTAVKLNADFVLWDLSPNISTFNRLVLTSCNGFFLPCMGDFSTRRAINLMEQKMAGFINRANEIRNFQLAQPGQQGLPSAVQPCRYVLPMPRPVFMGILMSRVKNQMRGEAPAAIKAAVTRVQDQAYDFYESMRKLSIENPDGGAQPITVCLAPEPAAVRLVGAQDADRRLTILYLPDFVSLNIFSTYLGVPAPFLDVESVKSMCGWSIRAATHANWKLDNRYFKWTDGFATRIKDWRDECRDAAARALRIIRTTIPAGEATEQRRAFYAAGESRAIVLGVSIPLAVPMGPEPFNEFSTFLNLAADREAFNRYRRGSRPATGSGKRRRAAGAQATPAEEEVEEEDEDDDDDEEEEEAAPGGGSGRMMGSKAATAARSAGGKRSKH